MTRNLALTLLLATALSFGAGNVLAPVSPVAGDTVQAASLTAPAPMSQLSPSQVEASSFDDVLAPSCDEGQCWRACRAAGAWGGSCVNGFCHCEEHP